MPKIDDYRQKLQGLNDWNPYLLKHSGLPGPRGNLELAQAVAELANPSQVEAFLATPVEKAPENSPQVFVVFCGVTALGNMAARGNLELLVRLRRYASDARWRVREAVAIGLQYVGDQDMPALLQEMTTWAQGNWYEKRAVAAALAEPRLLKDASVAGRVLRLFDKITDDIASATRAPSDSFKVLRQSMGYCWSVAIAANPADGKAMFEQWLDSSNSDVRGILKENLKKKRLVKMDAAWVRACQKKLEKKT